MAAERQDPLWKKATQFIISQRRAWLKMPTDFNREKRKNFIDSHSSTHSLDAKTVENIRSYFGLDDSTAVRNYLESLGVKEG